MLLSPLIPQAPCPRPRPRPRPAAISEYYSALQLIINLKACNPYPGSSGRSRSWQRPLLHAVATEVRFTSNDDASTSRDGDSMVSSASALAAAIRTVSTSPVVFVHKIEKISGKSLVLPSMDFQRLCVEQLDLFRRIVEPNAVLSVYVRPADSYVMDRLELRRIVIYPAVRGADIVVLVGNFSMPAGLRVAESEISRQQMQFFPELRAVVFPMVTHPFVVGFVVAELPNRDLERQWDEYYTFSTEQKLNAINITRSLAMGYVMDQKAMLLQQSAWQNNLGMSNLVEQIRGSLSSIQTLSRMLSVHLKRTEISFDIVEDILAQGDHMKDGLQQLQDAVYLTKASIMHYNNQVLKEVHPSVEGFPDSDSQFPGRLPSEASLSKALMSSENLSISSASKDLEFPMPPLALAPTHKEGIRRPCAISDVLQDLVGAIRPLANKQQRSVELTDLSKSLAVAVDEPALRQALSNLIEGALLRTDAGGRVEILSTGAPAGGALVIIDDDGPDMLYMTQIQSLAPFGADLLDDGKLEDNVTWNFIAGVTVARDILEDYGCVVRIVSPRKPDAPLGGGGTRLELWLPLPDGGSSPSGPQQLQSI